MTIANILASKERDGAPAALVAVEPQATVTDAVGLMWRHRIGTVLVMEGERLVGILSERDVVHLVGGRGAGALDEPVSSAMTPEPVTCTGTDTVDRAMAVMTERRFRHLPVAQGGRIVGMISIGDVVKAKIERAEHEVEDLKGYIAS